MRLLEAFGNEEVAQVYVLILEDGAKIECVASVQRPITRQEKWVLIISTLKGCPVTCPMCDAGGAYAGKLTSDEILDQIKFVISKRYPLDAHFTNRLKIQFARMGEPSFNDAVLEALTKLPSLIPNAPIQPSISTVAPVGRDRFFAQLLEIKNRLYGNGWFQMQFSIHTTDDTARKLLIPLKTWSLDRIADFGDQFFRSGDRKVALNFAPVVGYPLDPSQLQKRFSPDRFIIKLTPVNPTTSSEDAGLVGLIDPSKPGACEEIAEAFRAAGFETILNIGDLEENQIGSNCGMYVGKTQCKTKVA